MRNPPFVDDFRIEPSSSSPCLMTKGYTPFWKKLSHNSGRKTVFSTRTSGISAQASCKTSTRSAASPLVLIAAAADDDDDDDHGNLVHWLILYICFYMFLYIYIIHICKYCTLDLDSLIRFGYSLECSLDVQSRKIARVTVFLVQEILYGFYGHWWYLDVSQVYHAVSCSLGFQKLSWILLTPSNASLSKTSVLQIIR